MATVWARDEEASAFAAAEAHATGHLRRLRSSSGLISLSENRGFKINLFD